MEFKVFINSKERANALREIGIGIRVMIQACEVASNGKIDAPSSYDIERKARETLDAIMKEFGINYR